MPTVRHAQGDTTFLVATYAVERLSAAVANQDTGERVNALLARGRAGSSRSISISPYVLAFGPKLSDLLGHHMGSGDDIFVRLSPVVDHVALVESVIEYGADRTFSERSPVGGTVPLGVQLLGQRAKRMLA
jgi:hypothetical protein